jgi:hypothetical protein
VQVPAARRRKGLPVRFGLEQALLDDFFRFELRLASFAMQGVSPEVFRLDLGQVVSREVRDR